MTGLWPSPTCLIHEQISANVEKTAPILHKLLRNPNHPGNAQYRGGTEKIKPPSMTLAAANGAVLSVVYLLHVTQSLLVLSDSV